MPSFSHVSQSRLNTCHQDIITLMTEVIKEDDCTILCGHRLKADQDKAYTEGKSKLEWPDSKHNSYPSMAVDIAPYFPGYGIDWNDTHAFALLAGKIIQKARQLKAEGRITHGIRYGADWDGDGRVKDHGFKDYPHIELIDGSQGT